MWLMYEAQTLFCLGTDFSLSPRFIFCKADVAATIVASKEYATQTHDMLYLAYNLGQVICLCAKCLKAAYK